jgi:hypothetical protein
VNATGVDRAHRSAAEVVDRHTTSAVVRKRNLHQEFEVADKHLSTDFFKFLAFGL